MNRLLALILLLLCTAKIFAQGGLNYDWALKIGGTGNENIRDIQVSRSGSVYISGGFQNTVDFDPGAGTTNLTSLGSNDMFIAKYTSAGALVWVHKFGQTGDDYAFALALGEKDSVIVVGYFSGSSAIDFDPGAGLASYVSSGQADGLIAKYDSSGNFGWVNRISGTATESIYDVALDANQNIYITGSYNSTASTFSASPLIFLNAGGNVDAFIAKYDRSGNCLLANRIAGPSGEIGRSIAIDKNGDILVAGQFAGTCDFDASANTNSLTANNTNGFVAKYDNTGGYLWAQQMAGTTGEEIAYAVSGDTSGNVWVCGQFVGITAFGSFNVTGTTGINGFIAKYTTAGVCAWVGGYSGASAEAIAYVLDVDSNNNVYVGGRLKGTIDFDFSGVTKSLTSNPSTANDAFIAKYNNAGGYVWANKIGGTSSDEPFALQIINNSSFYMAGYFQTTADMDPRGSGQNLTSGGLNDAFLGKYTQCTLPPAPASIAGIDTSCSSFAGQTFTATPVVGATSYTWSLPGGWQGTSTTNVITLNSNMATGTISVRANDGCGTSLPASKTITIVFPPAQPAALSGATTVCPGTSQTYSTTAVAGVTYQWTLPSGWTGTSTTNSITVTTGSTGGTISVSAVAFCGASTPRTLIITALAPPNGSISPAAPTICSGSSVLLTASGGTGYAWSNGLGSGASKTVSPTVTTEYTVTVSHGVNVCTDVDTVTVTVLGALNANITPATAEICSGQSITLTASGGGTYAWSNSGGANAAATFSPTITTTYTVTVTNGSCTATASKTVTVNSVPTAAITPATAAICLGGSATLTASGGTTYTWSNSGGSNAAATFSPTTNTTYSVTVSNGTCSATASRLVTVNALPTASISPATVSICIGDSAILTANGG